MLVEEVRLGQRPLGVRHFSRWLIGQLGSFLGSLRKNRDFLVLVEKAGACCGGRRELSWRMLIAGRRVSVGGSEYKQSDTYDRRRHKTQFLLKSQRNGMHQSL